MDEASRLPANFQADNKVINPMRTAQRKIPLDMGPGKITQKDLSVRDYNIGGSDYAKHKIQPWDIWLEYQLNPWDADIIKRVLRDKKGDTRKMDYEKIKHICDERIRQLDEEGGD